MSKTVRMNNIFRSEKDLSDITKKIKSRGQALLVSMTEFKPD